MRAEDATFAMPPLPTWYRGRAEITVFLTRFALLSRWRLVPVSANGQLAFANYALRAEQQTYKAQTLDVVTLRGAVIIDVTAFVTPHTQGPAQEQFALDVFARFGLPDHVD